MSRFRRPLLICAIFGVLCLVALAVFLYNLYFSSTSYSLQRAEAFAFRRMAVAELNEKSAYRFFFVTNRCPERDGGPVEQMFGRDRDEALKLGSFDVKIQPTLGLGMLLNPTEWFQNEEIRPQAVRELAAPEFIRQLRTQVADSPRQLLLLVINGFRDSFPSALRKTAFPGHVLDINTPVVVFDWPGNQGNSVGGGYRRARTMAEGSAPDLARAIALIVNEAAPDRLSLIANSLGGQVVVDALRLLYQQGGFSGSEPRLDRTVLAAPDVDYAEFDEQFRLAIKSLARNTTLYVSANDHAPLASWLVNRQRRLGESSLRPRQLEQAARIIDSGPNSGDIAVVDVTPVDRTRNFHNFSLETPEFYDDVFLRLTNAEIPRNRLLYPIEAPNGSVYWVLTRGR